MSGQTISEKIFSQHVGHRVQAGDFLVAPVDFVFSHDANRPQPLQVFRDLGADRVFDADKVAFFLDHAPSVPNTASASVHALIREFAREQETMVYELGTGISHQVIPEVGRAVPGDLLVGSDSHTCTAGAFNALATGVGSVDIAVAMKTGKLWFKVPETVRFVIDGELTQGVYSKDVILYLIGLIGADGATYLAVEFTGRTVASLTVEARMTVTNMAVEMGAKFGLMEADDKTFAWLQERTERSFSPCSSDPDAQIRQEYRVDVATLEPQVAKPPNPDAVVPVSELRDIPIHQATIGTSANGQLDDLRAAASVLRGHNLAAGVRLFVTASSRRAYISALREGLVDMFLEAGAIIGTPGCSGCTGGSGLGIPGDGENMITSANRNFIGRTGNSKAFIYLASPATVIASAIEGRIADPRPYVTDANTGAEVPH